MSPAAPPAELRPGRPGGGTWVLPDGSVDSLQWVRLPRGTTLDLAALERAYHAWATRLVAGAVRAYWEGDAVRIAALPGWPTLIRMGPLQESRGRCGRAVLGGLLADPGGELAFELRDDPGGPLLTVALRGLRPRLPRPIYLLTQRRLHERVSFAFLRACVRALSGRSW